MCKLFEKQSYLKLMGLRVNFLVINICRCLSNIMVKTFCKKSRAVLDSIKTRQSRSALVRSVGSNCKWIPAPRPTFLWRDYFIDIEKNFKELRTIVIKLETEAQELRNEVVRILLAQKKELVPYMGQCSKETEPQEDRVVTSKTSIVVASPFRPPPPPPLPPSPVKSTRCLVVKVKPKSQWERDNSFLVELSTRPPKLRHVELSPGGRPVKGKRSPRPNDSSGLSYVLKKRYFALHNSPHLSIDHCRSSPVTSFL